MSLNQQTMSLTNLWQKLPFQQLSPKRFKQICCQKLQLREEEEKILWDKESLFDAVLSSFLAENKTLKTQSIPLLIRQFDNYLARRLGQFLSHQNFTSILSEKSARQSAFYKAFEQLIKNLRNGNYKGKANLETYFQTFFHQNCIDQKRYWQREKNLAASPWKGTFISLMSALSNGANQNIVNAFDDVDRLMLLKDVKLLKQLHEKCYQIIYWAKGMGYKNKEIANWLFSTENSIKSRVGQCLKLLKKDGETLKLNEYAKH